MGWNGTEWIPRGASYIGFQKSLCLLLQVPPVTSVLTQLHIQQHTHTHRHTHTKWRTPLSLVPCDIQKTQKVRQLLLLTRCLPHRKQEGSTSVSPLLVFNSETGQRNSSLQHEQEVQERHGQWHGKVKWPQPFRVVHHWNTRTVWWHLCVFHVLIWWAEKSWRKVRQTSVFSLNHCFCNKKNRDIFFCEVRIIDKF